MCEEGRTSGSSGGLGYLEEPDQLEPIQALGAGLIAVDFRQPGVDRGSEGTRPSMWAQRNSPRTPCIIVTTEESISPDSASWRM